MIESPKWVTFPPSREEVYNKYQELLTAYWTAEDTINLVKSQNVSDVNTIKELENRIRSLDRQLVMLRTLIDIYFRG